MGIVGSLIGGVMLCAAQLTAATVGFDVTHLGGDDFRYTYSFNGVSLAAGNELDIRFDPSLFGSLRNWFAGSGLDLLVLQPDNPPGAFGDYSLFALISDPTLTGRFSVDFTYSGPGNPGPQPYLINKYDSADPAKAKFLMVVTSGVTVRAFPDPIGTPEPTTFWLTSIGLLYAARACVVNRRSRP